jgi:hypothetical protein
METFIVNFNFLTFRVRVKAILCRHGSGLGLIGILGSACYQYSDRNNSRKEITLQLHSLNIFKGTVTGRYFQVE